MDSPTIVKDVVGNVLSRQYADGTRYDRTYDENGSVLGYRWIDGTGYDCTCDCNGKIINCIKISLYAKP